MIHPSLPACFPSLFGKVCEGLISRKPFLAQQRPEVPGWAGSPVHRDREKECGWGTRGWAVWAGKANRVQEGFYPGGRAAGEAKAI